MTATRDEIEPFIVDIWQKLLEVEQIDIHDNFFQLGGHALLALRLLNKLHQKYDQAELSWGDLYRQPTIAGLTQLIERAYNRQGSGPPKSIKALFLDTPSAGRYALIEAYLRKKAAQALGIEIDQIPASGSLAEFDLRSIIMDLVWDFKRDFQFSVYEHEILQCPSIGQLAHFLVAELERLQGLKPIESTSLPRLKLPAKPAAQQPPAPAKKNKGIIFLLSAPRSGSTLLRLMLAGHPALFCPPELNLLHHDNLPEWLQHRLLRFPRESGVVQSLMTLMGFDPAQGEAMLDNPAQLELSLQEVYRLIQQHVYPRTLLDKTPSYAKRLDILKKAEAIFEEPKYIHLVRHPYAVIESFVRHRFEKLIGEAGVDPYLCAEQSWATRNENILVFSQTLGPERYHLVRYEALVCQPAQVMGDLCDFLKIPFQEALLKPYEGGRMIGGPGDFDIFQHEEIEASLAESWKKVSLPRPLNERTCRLAAELGYELG